MCSAKRCLEPRCYEAPPQCGINSPVEKRHWRELLVQCMRAILQVEQDAPSIVTVNLSKELLVQFKQVPTGKSVVWLCYPFRSLRGCHWQKKAGGESIGTVLESISFPKCLAFTEVKSIDYFHFLFNLAIKYTEWILSNTEVGRKTRCQRAEGEV